MAAGKIDTGHKLTAVLAEFQSLRSEIQYRSEYQHRLLQIHITILTIIVPTLVTAASALPTSTSTLEILKYLAPWIIFIIPIESALFGIWFFDHGIFIGKIGVYIQLEVEKSATVLLGSGDYLHWESWIRQKCWGLTGRRYDIIISATFIVPSLIMLLLGAVLLFWITPSPYGQDLWWLALLMWTTGTLLFIPFTFYWLDMRKILGIVPHNKD